MNRFIVWTEQFIENARANYSYEVMADDNYDLFEIIDIFGDDGMPSHNTLLTDARWTVTPVDLTDFENKVIFFFKSAKDAVEFKLRFG